MTYGIARRLNDRIGTAQSAIHRGEPPVAQLAVTICGSFRRNPEALRADQLALLNAGCAILSPVTLDWVAEEDGFVFGAKEFGRPPAEIEEGHLRAMRSSHFVWLHAPGGYVGRSAAMEIGYAHALGLSVFALDLPADVALAALVTQASPTDAVQFVRTGSSDAPALGIDSLQRYYRRAALARGWESESVADCLRLLEGELVELQDAATADGAASAAATLEMADVQLYLVHLANLAGVDLAQAVVEKERRNTMRFGPAYPDSA